jgi:hypothetical protein
MKQVKNLCPKSYVAAVSRNPDHVTIVNGALEKIKAAGITFVSDAPTQLKQEPAKNAAGALQQAEEMQKVLQSVCAKTHTLTLIEQEVLSNACRSSAYGQYGTVAEEPTTRQVAESHKRNVTKDNKYQKRTLIDTMYLDALDMHINVQLGGRIDGVMVGENGFDVLVEVKNRVNRLFGSVPEYEKIQVMCYLFICNMQDAILVERKDDESIEHKIEYDAQYFEGIAAGIESSLQEVAGLVATERKKN